MKGIIEILKKKLQGRGFIETYFLHFINLIKLLLHYYYYYYNIIHVCISYNNILYFYKLFLLIVA